MVCPLFRVSIIRGSIRIELQRNYRDSTVAALPINQSRKYVDLRMH